MSHKANKILNPCFTRDDVARVLRVIRKGERSWKQHSEISGLKRKNRPLLSKQIVKVVHTTPRFQKEN